MATIKLKFRPSTIIGKKGTLYFQLIHSRSIKRIKTSYQIYDYEWDSNTGNVITRDINSSYRGALLKGIRDNIKLDFKYLNSIISDLENTGRDYKVDDIIRTFLESKSDRVSVFEYIKYQIDVSRNSRKERKSEILRQLLHSLMRFREFKDFSFDMINDKIIIDYEMFMRTSNLCRNTTSFYMRTFRSIFNSAVNEGIVQQSFPFKKVYTGIDKTSKRAITIDEIRKINNIDLKSMQSIEFARDIFMFSFYMRGMSFVDIAYLQKKNLSNGFLTYNRRKTGQQLTIKWEFTMQAIVDKYMEPNSDYIFPILNVAKGNLRRQYLSKMLLINRQLKKIAELTGIKTQLTMYVARHSWASIAQSRNVSLKAISLGMGHDNEETTRIYLDSIQTNIIDEANNEIIGLLNN